MAAIDGTITIQTSEYRPCFVNGRKALFHRWADKAETAMPSVLKGGHNGGQLWQVFGIVEYEDGTVREVYPNDITFVPVLMDEYDFEERSKHV